MYIDSSCTNYWLLVFVRCPWDLPDKSKLQYGDLEWFFFCPKSRKYLSGSRTNRATEAGYSKATGKDKEVKYKDKIVAAINTLVCQAGHPPKGTRTDWVKYRMDDKDLANARVIQILLVKIISSIDDGWTGMCCANCLRKVAWAQKEIFEEEEWDNLDDNEVVSFESSAMITKDTFNSNATVTNMTLTEPAPSTVTSSEPAPSTVLLDYELTDSILQITNTQIVEDCNGKPTDAPNGDDLIYFDLEALGTLDDLILDGFDMFTAEASGDIAGEDLILTSRTESCSTSKQNEQQSRYPKKQTKLMHSNDEIRSFNPKRKATIEK
ncbi:NAC domain-containing protein 82-like protein, partial [Tanacetum coccineum]